MTLIEFDILKKRMDALDFTLKICVFNKNRNEFLFPKSRAKRKQQHMHNTQSMHTKHNTQSIHTKHNILSIIYLYVCKKLHLYSLWPKRPSNQILLW